MTACGGQEKRGNDEAGDPTRGNHAVSHETILFSSTVSATGPLLVAIFCAFHAFLTSRCCLECLLQSCMCWSLSHSDTDCSSSRVRRLARHNDPWKNEHDQKNPFPYTWPMVERWFCRISEYFTLIVLGFLKYLNKEDAKMQKCQRLGDPPNSDPEQLNPPYSPNASRRTQRVLCK
jgi:hypothetical protein